MHHHTRARGTRLVAALAATGLLGLPFLTSTAEAAPGVQQGGTKPPAVKVMTRNLYLGTNIMRPIAAVQSVDPNDPECQGICYQLEVLNAFGNANDTARDIVDQTSFATRAALLAEELVTEKPDLVGLQEVALWRSGSMDDPLGSSFLVPNATDVDLDFLKMLLAETKAQGVPYRALSVNTLSDVEAPAFEGHYGASDFENGRDVRITMRDVILVRKSSPLTYVEGSAKQRTYDERLTVAVAGKELEFQRGYQWVDMMSGSKRFRFINTHLEAFGSDIAYAQAQQLVDGPGSYGGTTIIVCDCNSDPANGTIKPQDTKRHWAPYFLLKREGGFNDTWLQWAPPEEGFTSGLSELVDDEDASGFDHRIDLVLARTAGGDKLPVLGGTVTGDEVTDRGESGLWPSDHAGVVMRLRLR